jgi:phosphate transport system permease protein
MTAAVMDRPRRVRSFGTPELAEIAAPALLSVAVTTVLWALTALTGVIGFVVVAYSLFLAQYYVIVRRVHGRMAGVDRVVTVAVGTAAATTIVPLLFILGFVVSRGFGALTGGFFTHTMEGVAPDAPATAGGALHAIVGTAIQVGLAAAICVPFGVLTAVYLHEIGGRLVPVVRVIVDAMSGIPSIVAGLFIYAVWVVGLGQGFSGFAAALALGVLMLPTVARTTEEMLKLVDPSLREASLALGSPQWRTVMQVVLPTARTGIVTAVILGIARIAGETAPLLMTSFGNDRNNPTKMLSEPQESLPLFIFKQITNAQGAAVDRAWSAALVLIVLVLVLFTIARVIGRPRSTRPPRQGEK